MRQMIALDMPVKDAAESKNEDETEDYTERSKELSTVEKTVASTFQTRRGRSIAKKSRAYKRRCQVHMKAAIRWTKVTIFSCLLTYFFHVNILSISLASSVHIRFQVRANIIFECFS